MLTDDEIAALLRRVADVPPPIDDVRAARIRRQARAALEAETRTVPWLRPARRVWLRAVAPSLVVSAIAVYLTWAVSFSANLFR